MDEAPILFQAAAEFENLTGYKPALHCEKTELDRIVGKYEWDKGRALRCGLNGCNRTHWHGYVISTKNGEKTHIGQDCGAREFHVLWEEVHARSVRAADEKSRRANIADALQQRDALQAEVWSTLERLQRSVAGVAEIVAIVAKEPAYYRAMQDAMRNGGRIQRAAEGEAKQGEKIKLETIGLISHGSAMALHGSIVRQLQTATILPLSELTPLALETLDGKQLTAKSREITNARQGLRDALSFIDLSAGFCSAPNRLEMAKVLLTLPARVRGSQRARRISARLAAIADFDERAAA